MNNKKLYNIFLLSFAVLILAGCRSGGGGGGSLGSFSGDAGSSVGGGGGSSSSSMPLAHTPEPSSILLLTSGLIGMAVYAKARLKSKTKK